MGQPAGPDRPDITESRGPARSGPAGFDSGGPAGFDSGGPAGFDSGGPAGAAVNNVGGEMRRQNAFLPPHPVEAEAQARRRKIDSSRPSITTVATASEIGPGAEATEVASTSAVM